MSENSQNHITLCGHPAGRPRFSHMSRDGACYLFPLAVDRLSGTADVLNIAALRETLKTLPLDDGSRLRVDGGIRSFNNHSGRGPKLVIPVQALALRFTDAAFENRAELTGSVCKPPVFRRTPMGREICDVMLAVNRPGGRSDYIPCILWGLLAKEAAAWPVGTEAAMLGRLQSRRYVKNENGLPVEKTAFEVSVVDAQKRA